MKEQTTITMSKPVLRGLKELAAREKRTVSQQLEVLVESHFKTATRRTSAATESAARRATPRKGRAA
jgi:hypothetical protein